MKKILNKYCCVFFFLFGSFIMLSQPGPGGPPDHECCELIYKELIGSEDPNSPTNPLYIAYNECERMETANPGSYCNPIVPIDNSLYIYISIVAGVALASFVIARKIKA